jgi:DNA mismatch repair protein MutS
VHAADAHIKRLASLGHRIAICEQVEDPKDTGGKRLVRRAVVEVVTPGLVGDPAGLDAHTVVAVAAIYAGESFGLAVLEASTADFRATTISDDARETSAQEKDGELPEALIQELARIGPRELLVPKSLAMEAQRVLPGVIENLAIRELPESAFIEGPNVPDWQGGFLEAQDAASRAAVAVANYLIENQPFARESPPRLQRYEIADAVVLDASTRRHLELHENSEDRGRAGTLLSELDVTCCALGARRLSHWLAYPLLSIAEIEKRQDAVAFLVGKDRVRARLREAIRPVRDLDRLLSRATRPGAVPRDLGALRSSLQALPDVASAITSASARDANEALLLDEAPSAIEGSGASEFDDPMGSVLNLPVPLPALTALLEDGLIDEPPVIARGSRGANETGYIREGYRSDLDVLRESATKGREWIAGLEAAERERTGIATLKIRFHPVHGYSLEVGKAHLAKVPEDFERKQTLASVERFTTEALREVESKVMGANERAAKLEREIFESLRQSVCLESEAIREAAIRVAILDALASLAEVARRNRWVRPEVDLGESLDIKGGRHPVVESVLGRQGSDGFVPNDTKLDPGGRQILLLTGPNMSGKSTYLRQVALIVLMAQMGSFVPAESARVGIVDRVFTRVGASDRLSRGESTFMVEMRETAEILSQVTRRSLVILDEIGRGTSTFDGLSIAWSVAEYLHDTGGTEARTLFATHYHELVALSDAKARIHNAHFEVREWNDEVIFLRRLVDGGASRSYGIQVARLAGLPQRVIERARSILLDLEAGDLPGGQSKQARPTSEGQLSLGLRPLRSPKGEAEAELIRAFRELKPDAMTPIDALTWLSKAGEDLRIGCSEQGDDESRGRRGDASQRDESGS